MLSQFAIGISVIVVTVVIATVLMAVAMETFYQARSRLLQPRAIMRKALALSVITLSIVGVLSVVMWIWAMALLTIGVTDDFETAIEITMVSFTTLGAADAKVPEDWRLLPGFIGTGGFILFGLSTAFMFEAIAELRRAHRALRGEQEAG